jgi:hypothetical protein
MMLLFNSTVLIAGGGVVAIACLDHAAQTYGLPWLGAIVKLLLPLAALLTCVYFLQHNAILWWLR